MNTLHIKKGDTVKVLSGNDKGKTGKVTAVFPKTGLVVVEGIGMHTKHAKPRKSGQKGQIIQKQHPISASKVRKQK
jgi:large subunit ribosomal protein L24